MQNAAAAKEGEGKAGEEGKAAAGATAAAGPVPGKETAQTLRRWGNCVRALVLLMKVITHIACLRVWVCVGAVW